MSSSVPTGFKAVLKELLRTKTGLAGIIMLVPIIAMAIAAPLVAPLSVVKQWSNPLYWQNNPRDAMPIWVSWLLGKNLPQTVWLHLKRVEITPKKVVYVDTIDYTYDDYPSELRLYLISEGHIDQVWIKVTVYRPDGLALVLYNSSLSLYSVKSGEYKGVIYLSTSGEVSSELARQLRRIEGNVPPVVVPEVAVFSKACPEMASEGCGVLKGRYLVKVEISPPGNYKVVFVAFGKVYGLFGTDDMRRDIALGILWGAPIALAFGVIASVWTVFIQAFLGSLGAWYGSKVDELIQRLADIMLVLPLLPLLILIDFLYRLTVWDLLLVIMVFSIAGVVTKTVRPLTLQIASEQYIEAALSYGASKMRILLRYILPRELPYLIALTVMNVPGYIFLEAALCMLGLGDPELPTWGRILSDAWYAGAAYHGYWWWILTPAGFIAWTAIAFALIGYALDKIVNPRLREL